MPEARVIGFGYDARVASLTEMVSKARIGDNAKLLINSLTTLRARTKSVCYDRFIIGTVKSRRQLNISQTSRPIIFVAHSLGGLVCEDVRKNVG